jgi:hypothetical protein
METDIEYNIAQSMLHGMVDRLLEWGYLELISKVASREDPTVYTIINGERTDKISVFVTEVNTLGFRRDHFGESGNAYTACVRVDMHFRVVDASINSTHPAIEVVNDLFQIITRLMSTYDTFGKFRAA